MPSLDMHRIVIVTLLILGSAVLVGCGGRNSACVSDGECSPGLYCHPNFPGQGITPAEGEVSPPPSEEGKCKEGQPQAVPSASPDPEYAADPNLDPVELGDHEEVGGKVAGPILFFEGMDGLWFGSANPSPFGEMPYALMIQIGPEAVVARAEPPAGMGLPDGAYQQFVFVDTDVGPVMQFETSLAGELLRGTMPYSAVDTGPGIITFCNAADAGGCDAMRVTFEKDGEVLMFTTQIRGTDHSVMRLRLEPDVIDG